MLLAGYTWCTEYEERLIRIGNKDLLSVAIECNGRHMIPLWL
jgi:hypothetical protein